MYEYITPEEAGITEPNDLALLTMMCGAQLDRTVLPSGYEVVAQKDGHVVVPMEVGDVLVLVEVPPKAARDLDAATLVPREPEDQVLSSVDMWLERETKNQKKGGFFRRLFGG